MYIKRKIKSFVAILCVFVFLMSFLLVALGADMQTENYKDSEITLPIIMYHSILKDTNLQNDYTISPAEFEKDLKYITSNGYTTITVNDLVEYVYSNKQLPQKCIMLTFDDGYYNNYYYAYPLLKKYKCKAVISPIVKVTEKFTETKNISITYGNIGEAEIKEMINSGYVEFQNHSYDMHTLNSRRGVAQKKGESFENYKTAITTDITKAQEFFKTKIGVTPNCFVYPFGEKSNTTLDIVKELGFVCTITCTEKTNVISKNPDSLYELGRYLRKPNTSVEYLLTNL